jgi:hypothetical protein
MMAQTHYMELPFWQTIKLFKVQELSLSCSSSRIIADENRLLFTAPLEKLILGVPQYKCQKLTQFA